MSEQTHSSTTHPVLVRLTQLWWLPLLRGVMLIILGAYALVRPGMTVATFVQVFGFFLVFDGILAVIAGITGQVPSRGWTIARGVLAVIVGLIVMANPVLVAGFAAVTFVYVLGFSSILNGVIEIFAAIRDRKEIEGEGWLIVGGVISVLFGILLLWSPIAFAGFLVRVMGAVAIIGGIASILFAFRLRGLGKKLEQHDAHVGS